MHGSSPFTSSPFGEIDASPSDKDGKDDGVNGNLDVIPSPDESAKLVDLEPQGVAPSVNGNLENKSAIAENGNEVIDNGLDLQTKKMDPFSSLDGANGNEDDVDPFSTTIAPFHPAPIPTVDNSDAFGPLVDLGLPQPPTLNGSTSTPSSIPQTDLL